MKVKKDNIFYNISFIDIMLEVSDINELINDELIRHKLLTEDDPPIISLLSDISTFKIIILIEDGYDFERSFYLSSIQHVHLELLHII